MEAIEFKFEERLVTKAVGLPQEGFDLVVDAFHPAVVDAVLPPVQDSTSMEGESFGQLLHLTNARVDRPLAPFFEEDLHLVQAGLLPQQAQSLFRSEEHTSELQSLRHLVCRLLLEKKKNKN